MTHAWIKKTLQKYSGPSVYAHRTGKLCQYDCDDKEIGSIYLTPPTAASLRGPDLKQSRVYQLTALFLAGLLFLIFFLPAIALADGYVSLVGLPGISDPGSADMQKYINSLYRIAIIAAALIAVIKLILAGAQYVLSGIVTEKSQALKDIRSSLIGLLIIITAVTILTTINPELTNLPALKPAPGIEGLNIPVEPLSGEAQRIEEMCDKSTGGCTRVSCTRFTDPNNWWTWGLGLNALDNVQTALVCGSMCKWYGGELTGGSSHCTYPNDSNAIKAARVIKEKRILDNYDITINAPAKFVSVPFNSRRVIDDRIAHEKLIDKAGDDFIGYLTADWNSEKGKSLLAQYGTDPILALEAYEYEILRPACGSGNLLVKIPRPLEKNKSYYCVKDR